MTEEQEKTPQICMIKLSFPVENDMEAFEIKKALSGVLLAIPNARIDFSLLSLPSSVTNPKIPETTEPENTIKLHMGY